MIVLTQMLTSATQRSPISNPLTFLPISTTFPMASCPGISGNLAMNSPSCMCPSVPQTPQHVTVCRYDKMEVCRIGGGFLPFKRISSSLIFGIGTSLISKSFGYIGGRLRITISDPVGGTYLIVPQSFHSTFGHVEDGEK